MTELRTAKVVAASLAVLVSMAGCSHYNVQDTRGARAGYLVCNTVPGTHFSVLIHSSVDVECRFQAGGREDRYRGEAGISLGVDLSWNRDETFTYAVVTAYSSSEPGFLAGRYVGAQASLTIGVGAGVGVLVGGGERQVSLQPVGLEYGTGAGASAGLGYLTLEHAP